jgi:acetyl esterase
MRWFWASYLGDACNRPRHEFSLLRQDLRLLSPMTVITAEFDPLCDEGEALVRHLRVSGVPAVGRRYLGMIHGFASLPILTPAADRAIGDLAADILVSFRHQASG